MNWARWMALLRMDGKPLAKVFVMFRPEDTRWPQSTGMTDDAGQFELQCLKAKKGAVVGEHRVVLLDAAQGPERHSKLDDEFTETPPGGRQPYSQIYMQPEKTPLRRSVSAGSQTLDIDLSTKPK